jgi:hypothetical protein
MEAWTSLPYQLKAAILAMLGTIPPPNKLRR